MSRQQANSPENTHAWSELGKRSIQAEKIYCRRNPSDPWELDAIDLAIPTVAVALFLISGEFRKVL